jgi:hypothetical protein
MKEWGRPPVAAWYYYKHTAARDGRTDGRTKKPQTWRERATVCFGDGPQGASRLDGPHTAQTHTHTHTALLVLLDSIILFSHYNTWNKLNNKKKTSFASTRVLFSQNHSISRTQYKENHFQHTHTHSTAHNQQPTVDPKGATPNIPKI